MLDNLTGATGFDSSQALSYDGAPAGLTGNQIPTVNYVLSVVNGGAVTFDQQVVSAQTMGENVTALDHIYLKESDNKWWKVDADLTATFAGLQRGIALATTSADSTCAVSISGPTSGFSGRTPGAKQYASNTAGAISETPGTNTVFVGWALSATSILFAPYGRDIPSGGEKDALAGGSTFGTPSSTNKYITQEYLSSATGLPVVRVYTAPAVSDGGTTTQFDITNPAGTTFRYTHDGTGTNITINSTTFPVGQRVTINGTDFNAANQGNFVITGSGTNYFEVTNASGVVQSNVDKGATGTIHVGSVYHFFATSTTRFDITDSGGGVFRYTWDGTGTDPVITAARVPAGTVVNLGAQNFTAANNGLFVVTGSGANYFEVTNASGVAEVDKTVGTGWFEYGTSWTKPTGIKYAVVEVQGAGAGTNLVGGTSYFSNTAQIVSATGGTSSVGSGSGGDINIFGQNGGAGDASEGIDGQGGASFFGGGYGRGATVADADGLAAGGYARRLIAAASLDSSVEIGIGTVGTSVPLIGAVTGNGVVIVTEYYS